MWYGLTKEEALERCKQMALQPCFSVTQDPKTAHGQTAAPETDHKPDTELQKTVHKVIRVQIEGDTAQILLGRFAEGTVAEK